MPFYLNVYNAGIKTADSNFNGTDITVQWFQAYPNNPSNKIAYNIFTSEDIQPIFTDFFFNQSPSFISIGSPTSAVITNLTPGQVYHFGVRAVEYNPNTFDLSTLPVIFNNLRVLPQSLLSANIGATDTVIPLVDASEFPSSGVIKLATELIQYHSISNNELIVSQRGYNGTNATLHNIDGSNGQIIDGNTLFWDPNAILWIFENEEQNTQVYECQSRFDLPNLAFTLVDGYRNKTVDLLNTDLTVSDDLNTGFPPFDYAGYRRTSPIDLLNGTCVNSYLSGELGCYDGYTGSVPIRGISVQDRNLQRQEILLNTTGEPVILIKRIWTGITCVCMLPNQEYPEARCNRCLGTGGVIFWQQFFDPRRSDGKIMVRPSPHIDQVDMTESVGLESNMKVDFWTLTVPTLHERDLIIRFDQDGNEEFRYEILNVTRNKFFLTYQGMQKFSTQRIRKTDILNNIPYLGEVNTDLDGEQGFNILSTISTTISSSIGFVPHMHTITISQNIIDPSQINAITSFSQGHSHRVVNGVIDPFIPDGEEGLGHTHGLLF